MSIAYLSLGSNLGDRLNYLVQGMRHLCAGGEIRLEQVAPVYETAPWGKTDVPAYLNTAVKVATDLPPRDLLARCQAAEQACGRVRLERWGSRTLDVDMVLFDRLVLQAPDLEIPHPRMAERAFVLVPLLQLDPDLQLPDGRRLADLASAVADQGIMQYVSADDFRQLVQAGVS